ncbi:DUF2306 domain-containing protein [Evansella clarkii]|uniref:DUF2306 domain-containing protein n=1 Tax=Evansella clarkii TaxID=79879 RepID=UPI0009975E25|nr:DUF2306 domain-containing protein [Evansella clarkii]
MNWYFKIAAGFVFLSAIALGLASLIRYFVLDPVAGNQIIIDQGLEMYTMEHKPWKYALYVHIITASIAILIGPIQFLLNKTRSRRLSIHRSLGKLYVIAIAISGVAGVYLSLYAFGGFLSKLGFFALSISWLVTTYLAYYYIRQKNIPLHREWMYRSYAVTLAAVTFRIWSALIGYTLDNFTVGYVGAIWLALPGNLILAEMWIRQKRNN